MDGAPDSPAPGAPGATTEILAPAVVAVVVAHDPGDWFEECLSSLVAQDYPALSILVVDAASTAPVLERVAWCAPSAFVRRIEENPGFGAAANEVLEVVEGAAFYLLCHDDVALAPDVVRTLVTEAFRANASVLGPKLTAWDDTRRILQLGQAMDRTGRTVDLVERGEARPGPARRGR